jgi:hypothetical protein
MRNKSSLNQKKATTLYKIIIHFCTGLTIQQFNTILAETSSLTEASNGLRTVLGIYLSKLRTGEPNRRLATLFNVSRRTLSRVHIGAM